MKCVHSIHFFKKKKTIPIPTSTSSLKIPLRHISDSAIRKQRRGASRTASLVASDQSRNRTEYSIVRKGPCSKASWREYPSRSSKSSPSREDQCGTMLCHSTGRRLRQHTLPSAVGRHCILAKGCVTRQSPGHPQGTKFFWAAQ